MSWQVCLQQDPFKMSPINVQPTPTYKWLRFLTKGQVTQSGRSSHKNVLAVAPLSPGLLMVSSFRKISLTTYVFRLAGSRGVTSLFSFIVLQGDSQVKVSMWICHKDLAEGTDILTTLTPLFLSRVFNRHVSAHQREEERRTHTESCNSLGGN